MANLYLIIFERIITRIFSKTVLVLYLRRTRSAQSINLNDITLQCQFERTINGTSLVSRPKISLLLLPVADGAYLWLTTFQHPTCWTTHLGHAYSSTLVRYVISGVIVSTQWRLLPSRQELYK